MMTHIPSLRAGIAGTLFGAICCFTPFLVIVFGFAGVSAWLGWIDYLLFPVMFASLGVVAHALYISSGNVGPNPKRVIIIAILVVLAVLFWLEFRFAIRISLAAVVAVAGYGFYLRRGKVAAENANKDAQRMEEKS